MIKLIKLFAAGALCAAATLSQAAVLTHDYELNGTFADAFGGPSLVSLGGTLNATNYAFQPNQGLSLSNALANNGNYSIELLFSFDATSGFRRIVEFKNLTDDRGLYNLNTALNFFNVATGPAGAINAGQTVHVILTRDSATNAVTGYVGGVQQISFTDASLLGVFSGPNSIMHFFRDDNAVAGEASAGSVDFIRVFDGALTAANVTCLQANPNAPGQCGFPLPGGNNVPAPAPLALFGIAAMAFGLGRRRKI